MLIMAVHQTPSLTQERYEEVVRRLTNREGRLESTSDLPFDGIVVHIAGQGKNGFCVVDVLIGYFNGHRAGIEAKLGG